MFVTKGQETDFEVTENPESMLSKEADLHVGGLPITVGNVTVDTDGIKYEQSNDEPIDSDGHTEMDMAGDAGTNNDELSFDKMSVKELREYAKRNDIEIPSAVRVKAEILNIIKESE